MLRVQWRYRRQLVTAVAATVLLSTLAILQYSRTYDLENVSRYIRDQVEKRAPTPPNVYKMYEEGTPPPILKPVPTLKKKVHRAGIYQRDQQLTGSILDERGVVSEIKSNITSELVFAFSPSAEENFAAKLVDPNHEQKVYANSPAMIWDGEKFIVVMRMWLDKEHTHGKTMNTFSDNYFYKREYNDRMEPLDVSGKVVGIPTRILNSIGDGPIEPRAFPFYNQIFLSFNVAMYVGKKEVDTTTFWDWTNDKVVMPQITNGQPQFKRKVNLPRDKHWSPYEYDGQNYMIYSIDPLRIISCNATLECKFSQNAAKPGYQFVDVLDSLRGGTPTVHYADDFYITIAHTTLFRPGYKRYYTINLLVLKAAKHADHQVVYASEPINFDREIMTKTPIVRTQWIEDPFFFPVTLLLEDADNIIIGGHINDHSAYLFRVKGVKSLMDRVMAESKSLHNRGPANGVLQSLARRYAVKQSGYKFVS